MNLFGKARSEYEEESHLKNMWFDLEKKPFFICRGLKDGLNLGIAYIGKATPKADEIIDAMRGNDKRYGKVEHENVFVALDVGNLSKLLESQIKLQNIPREKLIDFLVNSDGTNAPMVDEYFGGFWMAYEQLTGSPRPKSLSIENLAKQGIEIELYPKEGENFTDVEYPFL